MSQNIGNETLSVMLKVFFTHIIKLKMYHFQTQKYGAHKASDKYLEKFLGNFDRFMEVAQGIHGKVDDQKIELNIDVINDSSINGELDKFAEILNQDSESFYKSNKDLLAIRDEMLAEVNQLKYLLTFQ